MTQRAAAPPPAAITIIHVVARPPDPEDAHTVSVVDVQLRIVSPFMHIVHVVHTGLAEEVSR